MADKYVIPPERLPLAFAYVGALLTGSEEYFEAEVIGSGSMYYAKSDAEHMLPPLIIRGLAEAGLNRADFNDGLMTTTDAAALAARARPAFGPLIRDYIAPWYKIRELFYLLQPGSDVDRACAKVRLIGAKVTVRHVRAQLGGGSFSTLGAEVRANKVRHGEVVESEPELVE